MLMKDNDTGRWYRIIMKEKVMSIVEQETKGRWVIDGFFACDNGRMSVKERLFVTDLVLSSKKSSSDPRKLFIIESPTKIKILAKIILQFLWFLKEMGKCLSKQFVFIVNPHISSYIYARIVMIFPTIPMIPFCHFGGSNYTGCGFEDGRICASWSNDHEKCSVCWYLHSWISR